MFHLTNTKYTAPVPDSDPKHLRSNANTGCPADPRFMHLFGIYPEHALPHSQRVLNALLRPFWTNPLDTAVGRFLV